MRSPVRVATAVALAALCAAGMVTTAAAAPSPAHTDGYGYTVVRRDIPDKAVRFLASSPDVRDGGALPASHWANGFGCDAPNQPVRLTWTGAPAGTRGYAVTMFDPDAPTGSGFWHWLIWDIPATARQLGPTPPPGAVSGTDDAGVAGYLGPCPPAGDIAHRYQLTVYALDIPTLGLPGATPPAIVAFTLSSHVLGYARITAMVQR
ncbi:YbhB/YbcL family Raf kinase inhibitor-like protein [Frankia sp. AgB1.9]|uniref:YbhB/YbcL family Raf kinase inhibitor-like protein n=1 Tax=unclassified Frankia TaxID=2632575 RepID=UPI0019336529|nr:MULTISPECIES: YbhB/YbcL family Raf kinase inhibitor-like protein [unclassified Frankia]MBL7492608.1 YbhB/YbcL family Raf kinase inhibitor-like protein [Frankia sp. AgW1.1]MBL7549311.1 YbhB/YbcL family Raf kinase inhibitor-like protein [Frankia sp. AgB1.9]MBL7619222.1 YbhB/YbcL family Raf kinase inhibitor-like protein [Frankia sp. AgB1.8]